MDILSEELDVIRSIYCMPGECRIEESGDWTRVTLTLRPDSDQQNTVPDMTLTFIMNPQDYPNAVPQISIMSAYLQRSQLTHLRQEVDTRAKRMAGHAMLADLIASAQDYLNGTQSETPGSAVSDTSDLDPVAGSSSECELWTSLLHLDHMRAKHKYIKTIKNWTTELDLNGRLLFQGKLILILLQGPHSRLKDYLIRQRSVNVDVDSKGKSCKEKMLSVLCDVKCKDCYMRFTDFQVLECASPLALETVFTYSGYNDIFTQYVRNLDDFHG